MKNSSKNILIYKIGNHITGKCYIGFSSEYSRRKSKHLTDLKLNRHHSTKLQNSWNKYGKDAFKFEILEEGIESIEIAQLKEIETVSKYDSYENGYNMTPGGEGIHGHFGEKHWNRVEIYVYSTQGEYIKSFPTLLEAFRELSGDKDSPIYPQISRTRGWNLFESKCIISRNPLTKGEMCKTHRYDLNGKYIDSFYSDIYAERIFGGCEQNIARAIRSKGTYKGYQWRREFYDSIDSKEVASKDTTRKVQGKPINMIDKETGEILKTYDVLADAIREFGYSISSCVRGITKTAYGYKWKYADLSVKH